MNPRNHWMAGRQAAELLERRLRHLSAETRRRHIRRADQIAQTIWKRWHVGVYRWQLKHVRWVLSEREAAGSRHTYYQYVLTARLLADALGKGSWDHVLLGSWCRSKVDLPDKSDQ